MGQRSAGPTGLLLPCNAASYCNGATTTLLAGTRLYPGSCAALWHRVLSLIGRDERGKAGCATKQCLSAALVGPNRVSSYGRRQRYDVRWSHVAPMGARYVTCSA